MFNKTAYGLGSVRSYIREVFEYGRQQAKIVGEENVFDYSLGNPSIPAPEKVNETIINILNTESSIKVHGYTSGPGDDTIREAVAKNLTERFGKVIRPANLFFTCGAAPALMTALTALACEDSEVIAIAPFFPEYKPFIESSGNKFVMVPADTTSFQIDMAALESLVNEHTQAIIVNSPNNPSGVVFSQETLEKVGAILGAAAEKYGHPIYIIADEPYRELVYDGVEVPFIPNVYKDTIVCYSWSKSLSLPGERIGYVLVPDDAADSAELFAAVAGAARMLGHVCAPSLIQRAVAACCDIMPDLEAYDVNRNLLYNGLTEIGYECAKPQGAFYLFVKAPGGDAMAFAEKAKKKNLLIVPSDSFGVPGYFRLSYCVSKEMIERSLPAFKEVFAE
ncbi:MAG: pyridoxal phosphate-dependent aminotransferase [Oscillospiraceae bacterium]|nr:pyridoxal phosphate-dependent aminotransferase [Oscillospiraceae bacterium]